MKPDLVTPERMLLRWGENCLYHCIMAYRIAQQPHNKHNHYRKITTQQTNSRWKKNENEVEEKNVEKCGEEAIEMERKRQITCTENGLT